ncbi:putative M18 family aminopeptidase 2 [Halioglobus japonicus]|nr:putative M18 family aminopeptidase 2 [Halioglobus japonicus]
MNQDDFNQQLTRFLAASTTPFHAVAEMVSQLMAAGFSRLTDDKQWNIEPGGRYFLTRNDSSIVAFVIGDDSPATQGMRMVGAHTDSPCLMVKPSPEILSQGLFQLGVQVYGGALLNPWFDRDLSLAGRVSFLDDKGQLRVALIDFRDAIATVPSLAIHLDREANKNREVNPQTAIVPVLCQVEGEETIDFRALLQQRIQQEHPEKTVAKVLDYEMSFYDTQAPSLIGLHREFIASARLDNLLSCFTGLQALLQSNGSVSSLLICNDHEEVGSVSTSGANGPLLTSVLNRLAGDTTGYAMLAERSMMISADNAHAIHPNFADRHDENHGPQLNHGPVIKVNASQRYATNSETSGLFRLLAGQEEVPVQSFVVRSDMGCGSTIGPISAGATGIRTLDIGVPTLGMHSIRELAGSRDAWDLSRILSRFYNHTGPLSAT